MKAGVAGAPKLRVEMALMLQSNRAFAVIPENILRSPLRLGGRAASPRPPDPYPFWGEREATPGQVGGRWGVGTRAFSGVAVAGSAEDACILGTEQPLHDLLLPIEKEIMGLSESWSRTAPVVAVTKGSNSSPSELSGMLTLPRSLECPPGYTHANPWSLALCSPHLSLLIVFQPHQAYAAFFPWPIWLGLPLSPACSPLAEGGHGSGQRLVLSPIFRLGLTTRKPPHSIFGAT